MDLQRQRKVDGCDSGWTNKRHHSFLDSMEASFVRRMFENNDRCFRPNTLAQPRLDRYLPDGADSTLDFKRHIGRSKTLDLTPVSAEPNNVNMNNASQKKRRRRGSSAQDNPSIDQVVPSFGSEKGDGVERE